MFTETPIKFVVEKNEKDLHVVAVPLNKLQYDNWSCQEPPDRV